jgi:hypothetical protein
MEMLGKQMSGRLIFTPEQVLPRLFDGEFYQFVYVAGGKYIRGVSIPFQFKKSTSINVPSNCTSYVNIHKPTIQREQSVIFETEEFYPEGKPVECLFRLNGSFKVEPTDFIGIFKVGVSSPREFYTQMPVPMEMYRSLEKVTSGKLIFTPEHLPKCDGELYQFVYVADGRYIRAQSIPFTLKRVGVSESKWSSYEKLIHSNENVMKMIKEELSGKIKSLKLAMENEVKMNGQWKQQQHEEISQYTQMLQKLNGEIQLWRAKYEEVSIENRGLFEQLQRRVQQIDSLRGELELLRLRRGELSQLKETTTGEELRRISDELRLTNEKMIRWEREFEEKCGELNKIKIELRKSEMLVEEQTQSIKTILGERDSLLSQINMLKGEKIELVQSKEWISKDLLMTKERLVQAERYRDMYKVQLELLRSELECVSLNGSKLNWSELMQKMEQEWIMREKQLYGSYYSLQYANGYLTKRINTQSIELNEQKQKIVELMNENELLQEKLRNGAYEYACLNKKYLVLVNGKHEIVPTTMTPSSSFVVLPEHSIVNKPTTTTTTTTTTHEQNTTIPSEHIVSSVHKSCPVEHPITKREAVECVIPSTLKPTTTITQHPKPTVVPTPRMFSTEQHLMTSHKLPEKHLESGEFTTIRREQPIQYQQLWSTGERREFVKTPFGDYHLTF